jgi:hypothetical protein
MTLEQLQQIFPGATADTWHQHPNGGGWVQNTAKVYETAWVGKDAVVYGDAVVLWNSSISGNARVLADGYGSGGEEMTLEKALERIEFLENALNGAIGSCIKDEECDFTKKPELVEYIKQNWLNALIKEIDNE